MFDGTEFRTRGMLTAMVKHPVSGKEKRMEFYVLGMEACLEM